MEVDEARPGSFIARIRTMQVPDLTHNKGLMGPDGRLFETPLCIIIIIVIIIIIIIWILCVAWRTKSSLGPQWIREHIKRLSPDMKVRIWQVKEKCLKTLSEYRERRCRCLVWWKTVPEVGVRNWKSPFEYRGEIERRYSKLVGGSRLESLPGWHGSDTGEIWLCYCLHKSATEWHCVMCILWRGVAEASL